MNELIKLLRPHQYIKNLFIFAPIFFSFHFETKALIDTLIAFILFSCLASSVYVFNDLMDIEEDRKHPKKRFRPLASAKITKNTAKKLIFFFALVPLSISFIVNINLFYLLLFYFILNILYSLKLKHISIVDIFIIAIGFVLRLFVGSTSSSVDLSMWIIIMTFLLALFLAVAKRREDVLLSKNLEKTRKNISGYNLEFINALMVFMSGVILVSYILYTTSPDIVNKFQTHNLYLTSIFVLLGIVRYMQITFVENNSGSPSRVFLKDWFLKTVISLWLISFYVVVNIF